MKKFLILLICLVGCSNPSTEKLYKYSVKITRPDGVVHKDYVIESTGQPLITHHDGGQSSFFEAEKNGVGFFWKSNTVPTGWLVEIEPLVEKN